MYPEGVHAFPKCDNRLIITSTPAAASRIMPRSVISFLAADRLCDACGIGAKPINQRSDSLLVVLTNGGSRGHGAPVRSEDRSC